MKIPKTLGAKIDALYTLREKRLAIERSADVLRAKEAEFKESILAHLTSEKAQRASGKLATCSATVTVVGKAYDWAKIWEYAKKRDASDLFQRRINNKAWLDRVEAGEKILGIERETVLTLSLSKAGA